MPVNPFLIRLLQKTQGDKPTKPGETPEIPRSWYFLFGTIFVILIVVIALETIKQHNANPQLR